jgi:diguanylate cyclase (GGDEF)-like protein
MNEIVELEILYELINNINIEDDLNKLIELLMIILKKRLSLKAISLFLLSQEKVSEYKLVNKYFKEIKHKDKLLLPAKDSTKKTKNGFEYTFCFESEQESVSGWIIVETSKQLSPEKEKRVKLLIKNVFLYFIKLYRVRKLSFHDEFTGLYNNRYLREYLKKESERALRYNTFFSIIFLDLDGLKKVNDTFGHLYGGKLLMEVGTLLIKNTRTSDIVGRFGGDEFLIIIFGARKKETKIIAERIRKRIKAFEFLKSENLKLKITASMGISTFPDDSDKVEELIAKADKAMYKVKKRGKDGVECYEEEE